MTSFLRISVPGPRATGGGRLWLAARLFNDFATLGGRRRGGELLTSSGSSKGMSGQEKVDKMEKRGEFNKCKKSEKKRL